MATIKSLSMQFDHLESDTQRELDHLRRDYVEMRNELSEIKELVAEVKDLLHIGRTGIKVLTWLASIGTAITLVINFFKARA